MWTLTGLATQTGELLLVAFLAVGPLIGLLRFLNARERGRTAAPETMWYLAPRDPATTSGDTEACDG